MYVFTPNNNQVVYKKQNIFGENNKNTSILWTLFAPKSDHQKRQNSSWLDSSTLYMLTNQQVIFFEQLRIKIKIINILFQELLKFDKTDTLQSMIETFVDDNFTNLTPLGRIISNREINHNAKRSSKKLPEFESLIGEDKSAFEVK